MTQQMYLIKWHEKGKPREIKGNSVPVDEQTADEWVKEMNLRYPSVWHYKEAVSPKCV